MKLMDTKIAGLFEIRPRIFEDERGNFVKIFQKSIFQQFGLATGFVEEYYSSSKRGVLRGLHFQLPPHEHAKVVSCFCGEVFEVVADLRHGSPTYGQFEKFIINSKDKNFLYIAHGLAHGFYALSDEVMLSYRVTAEHSPEHDSGILWNSLPIPWPSDNPILSDRDAAFKPFQDFKTPFVFDEK